MFAKIYGPDVQQVLILKDEDEEGNPQLKIMTNADSGGIVSLGMGFDDTDDGWEKLDRAFEQMDEVTALKYISNLLDELLEQNHNDEYE